MTKTEIVAVAFLTRTDLEAYGSCLDRVFAVENNEQFEDLLSRLNGVPATSSHAGADFSYGKAR